MPGLVNKKLGSHYGDGGSKKQWHIGRVIRGMDSFSMEVPSFNIKGETRVNTLCGGIVSCLILLMTLAFAAHNAVELFDAKNPTINKVTTPSYFSNEHKLVLKDANFKMAFTFYDRFGKKTLNDSKYLQWFITMGSWVDGVEKFERIGFHDCTEEDYAEFFPVRTTDEDLVKNWKKKGLSCFDKLPEDMYISGTFKTNSFKGLHITFGPCNLDLEDQGITPTDDCIGDLNK